MRCAWCGGKLPDWIEDYEAELVTCSIICWLSVLDRLISEAVNDDAETGGF
jgi:hypothetical protein